MWSFPKPLPPAPDDAALRRLRRMVAETTPPDSPEAAELLHVLGEQLLALARVHEGGHEVREELGRLGATLCSSVAEAGYAPLEDGP